MSRFYAQEWLGAGSWQNGRPRGSVRVANMDCCTGLKPEDGKLLRRRSRLGCHGQTHARGQRRVTLSYAVDACVCPYTHEVIHLAEGLGTAKADQNMATMPCYHVRRFTSAGAARNPRLLLRDPPTSSAPRSRRPPGRCFLLPTLHVARHPALQAQRAWALLVTCPAPSYLAPCFCSGSFALIFSFWALPSRPVERAALVGGAAASVATPGRSAGASPAARGHR